MKLGVSYIVFDGVELLEHSIKQIRDHVDWIQVIYQNRSWFGHSLPKEDLFELKRLEKTRWVNELTIFDGFTPLTDYSQNSIVKSKSYERNKRQLGLQSCLRNGCTHYLCMDVDEFYISQEFKEAKDNIIKEGLDVTSVKYINYVNLPTLHRGSDGSTVPFICRINQSSTMGRKFFSKCDPTRGIETRGIPKNKMRVLNHTDIKMHHMETVRKNLLLKYQSTTRSIFNRQKTSDLINNIRSVNESTTKFGFNRIIFPAVNGVELKRVDNIFNIPYETWIR